MSGAITATGQSDSGWMSSLISDAANVRAQEQTLTNQVSTGQVSSTYAGLGSGAAVSLDINPEIANLTTWQSNINQAAGTMDVTQTAMTQLQSIASSFYAQVNSLNTGAATASSINTIAASAQSALQQVAGLLDTTDGNTYVFGGADTANPPVPNPDAILTSGFATQISGEVANLATSGATATASAIIATGSSNTTGTSPFSLYMSQSATTLQAQAPVVQVGQGQIVQIGLLASANSSAVTSSGVSTGTSTGSYMRDLMSALATIGSLSASQVGQAGFQGLMQSTGTTLQGVVTAMGSDAGVLGNTQTALTASQSQMADTVTALTTQVGAVQNVDMAQTMSNLTLVQTQLQASYQMIAGMSALSLVKFLPS